jgi:hypothetical protein
MTQNLSTIEEHLVNGAARETGHLVTPAMSPDAYYGLAGRIVDTIKPYTEADPVALLLNILVAVGNVVGRGPHATVEATVHGCNEYVALVGRTSKARKGQSASTPQAMLTAIDETWMRARRATGLSSGEGVIYQVRDARTESQPIRERGRVVGYEDVIVDTGVVDKRLFVVEPEFATVLRRMHGEGNTLSAILREAWDSGRLQTLTRHNQLRATDAHVSILAHITQEELLTSLTETERANGFANRFLFAVVRRAQVLPEPEGVPAPLLDPLITELRQVQTWATVTRRLTRDAEAKIIWAGVYPKLSEGEPGLIGAVLARAEAHVLRLSLLYAVLDCAPQIRPDHLRAALAVWDYAETSARRIFGPRLGLTVADTIEAALGSRDRLTRTEINALFGRNRSKHEIDAGLTLLRERGRARQIIPQPPDGQGRPAEVWERPT